jgi:hypothetical protein
MFAPVAMGSMTRKGLFTITMASCWIDFPEREYYRINPVGPKCKNIERIVMEM